MPITFNQSILVSNIFDPITHDIASLNDLYEALDKQGRYSSIETRVSDNDEHIAHFNTLIEKNQWIVTGWVTGDITRAHLNPSALDEALRLETVDVLKSMMDNAIKNNMTYFGLGSGPYASLDTLDLSIGQFEKTLRTLLDYADQRIRIIVEPLDAFAHKKNVLGTTDSILKCFSLFDEEVNSGALSMCWDSAHFALNEEDFETSIHALAPYISRIHYSNAILDANADGYGDHHMKFVDPGFLTPEIAASIIAYINNAPFHQENLLISNEIRATASDDLWALEDFCYEWILSALDA